MDRSLGFYVLSLVVGADYFRRLCAGCADEVDLFETAEFDLYVDHFDDCGKILLMVRCDVDDAAGLEATDDLLDISGADESPFVMPLLRPGVRKVDMKATD